MYLGQLYLIRFSQQKDNHDQLESDIYPKHRNTVKSQNTTIQTEPLLTGKFTSKIKIVHKDIQSNTKKYFETFRLTLEGRMENNFKDENRKLTIHSLTWISLGRVFHRRRSSWRHPLSSFNFNQWESRIRDSNSWRSMNHVIVNPAHYSPYLELPFLFLEWLPWSSWETKIYTGRPEKKKVKSFRKTIQIHDFLRNETS